MIEQANRFRGRDTEVRTSALVCYTGAIKTNPLLPLSCRFISSRMRRFLDALAIGRDANAYDSVFEQTQARLDAEFTQYVEG